MTTTAIADGIALYRVFGENNLLLYIGISNNFGRRWRQHARKQPWWSEMRRLTVDSWYPTRGEAEEAETSAISAERPKYNVQGNRPVPAKPDPAADEDDYESIVSACDRLMHSLWHDGYDRAVAWQMSMEWYAPLQGQLSYPVAMRKAHQAFYGGWRRQSTCPLCQRGIGRSLVDPVKKAFQSA